MDEVGQVRLVGELDREATAMHTVLVLATDDGEPPRTATATLTVSRTRGAGRVGVPRSLSTTEQKKTSFMIEVPSGRRR